MVRISRLLYVFAMRDNVKSSEHFPAGKKEREEKKPTGGMIKKNPDVIFS